MKVKVVAILGSAVDRRGPDIPSSTYDECVNGLTFVVIVI